MRLGLLTCIWKRHELAALSLAHNLAAAAEADIEVVPIAVGSEGVSSAAIAEEAGWQYLHHANQPLGAKWNAGMELMKDLDVGAVMIVGSDDFLSVDLFTAVASEIATWAGGPLWYGVRDCYVLHAASGRLKHFEGYAANDQRAGEPIGTARVYSNDWLALRDWKPWPDDAISGLDRAIRLTPEHGRVASMAEAGPILDVKAYPLHDLNSFWAMHGELLPKEKLSQLFPRLALALRAVGDPAARAERIFNPPADGKKPFLTACLMVKNERNGIAECLASLVGVADEVCVLDTGSADGTPEIAEAYGCIVERVDAEQPFNFGKWRNHNIRMGTGEWIMVLDGDEWVRGGAQLLANLRGLPPGCDVLALHHNLLGVRQSAEGASIIPRCLNGDKVRSGALEYLYPVHHQLVGWERFALANGSWTEEPWFDVAESAPRAIAALEKMLAMSSAPDVILPGGKALGGRKREREHALLYLARSWCLMGSGYQDGSPAAKSAFEKAALYAGQSVDENPGQAGAWLVLLAAVERARGLEYCAPILAKAMPLHPQLIDLLWWQMRVCAAGIATIASGRDPYPLVPKRAALYVPLLASIGPFLSMRFGDDALQAPAAKA